MKPNERRLQIVIILTALWVVALPPIWTHLLATPFGQDPLRFLSFYVPELVIAGACLILLPGAWLHRRWAVRGLVVAAFILPALKTWWLGSPDSGNWLLSSALLLLVAWGSADHGMEPAA